MSHAVTAQNFKYRTSDVRLSLVSGTNGVAVADYDRDGDLDVYFVVTATYDASDPRTWNRLFANRGNGTFALVSAQAVLSGHDVSTQQSPMGHKMGASWGDYDNDGWPDLYLTHYGRNQLLHNQRDGTFVDVTDQAGVAGGNTQLSSSALWVDYDHDGDLDLYVSNWEDFGGSSRDLGNLLYENVGDGQFIDASQASGLADKGATWTTVALDVNNDGLLDLYLANDFGRNKLYVNNGDKTFREETKTFGLENVHHGMGVAIADCDGNGHFDIYLTNITESGFDQETNPLFLNSGQNHFADGAVDAGVSLAGWGWGTEFFDLENDGDEDLFVATGYFEPEYSNVLFRNRSETGSLGFERITGDVGLADSTTARGLAVYDFDDDGDQDLLISNFQDIPSLYENPMTSGNWVKIKLEGTISNRDAFGSIVEVTAGGKTHRRYHHGAQFLGQNILPVHVGLGNATMIDRIAVRWTNGYVDEVEGIAPNRTVLMKETVGLVASPTAAEIPHRLKPFQVLGNYPNPFRGSTTIRIEMDSPGIVELQVFDTLGRTVSRTRRSYSSAGVKTFNWTPSNDNGSPVGAGIYPFRIQTDGRSSRFDTGMLVYLGAR